MNTRIVVIVLVALVTMMVPATGFAQTAIPSSEAENPQAGAPATTGDAVAAPAAPSTPSQASADCPSGVCDSPSASSPEASKDNSHVMETIKSLLTTILQIILVIMQTAQTFGDMDSCSPCGQSSSCSPCGQPSSCSPCGQ